MNAFDIDNGTGVITIPDRTQLNGSLDVDTVGERRYSASARHGRDDQHTELWRQRAVGDDCRRE